MYQPTPPYQFDKAQLAARVLKTLANPARLLLLCALAHREHTAGELENVTGLGQSACSQHLSKLRAQSLVHTRRDGQKICYSLADPAVRQLLHTLHELYCAEHRQPIS